MGFATIMNVLLLVILVVCAWHGYKKGILMGLVDLLVFVIALFGGQMLSSAFSPEITPALRPFVSGFMNSRIDNSVYELLGYEADETGSYSVSISVNDLLASNPGIAYDVCLKVYEDLGIYAVEADELAEETASASSPTGLPDAITDKICYTAAVTGGFLLFFLLVFIALTVVVNLFNLSFRLPYFGLINDIGGIALGVFLGCLYCTLVLWFLQFTGMLLPEEKLRTASLAVRFLDSNLLSSILSF